MPYTALTDGIYLEIAAHCDSRSLCSILILVLTYYLHTYTIV